jgi:alpha-tubulin suppressor-like RCC1 family protein
MSSVCRAAAAVIPTPRRLHGFHSCCICVQVAAGSCHSIAVTAVMGRVYAWGWNAHGGLAQFTASDTCNQLCDNSVAAEQATTIKIKLQSADEISLG